MSNVSSLRSTGRKRTASFLGLMLLVAMLGITTFAATIATLELNDNLFHTGTVDINFTQDAPYFVGDNNVEAGYSMARVIGVENKSSAPVYYKLYITDVRGSLAPAMIFNIYDDGGNTLLYSARATDFTEDDLPFVSDEVLGVGAEAKLRIVVTVDTAAGNTYQGGYMDFNLIAKAVQVKNNPNKDFD